MKNKLEPKNLEDLNLIDDFLFSVAVQDQEFCRKILEIVLGVSIREIRYRTAQKNYDNIPGLRGIRLDAYIEDSLGTVYDIEMQVQNTRNLPRRSRYYQSMMDSELLLQGVRDFNKLNNIMIIIITPFDPFGQKRYQYTFDYRCREDVSLFLNDGARRIFLNTHGENGQEVRSELIQFLKYVENSTEKVAQQSESGKILWIHEQLKKLKNDRKVGALFMKSWEWEEYIREKATEEGLEQGREQGLRAFIPVLRESGISDERIATHLIRQFDMSAETAAEYLKKY